MSQDNNKKMAHKKLRPTKRNLGRSSWLSAISDVPPFIHAIIIVILLVILFLLFVFSGRGSSDLYRTAKKENATGKIVSLNYNVFGDHFVNNLAVNSSLTNFYYDNITTAYTFTPEYSWQDMGACRDRYCGFKAVNYHFPEIKDDGEKVEYCITKGCLCFTKNILEDKEGADSAWCRASDNSGDLVVVIEKNGKYYQRLLQDNGFTQKQNYRIVTNNLLTEEGEIEKASFSSLLACDDKSCSADVLKNSLAFSVSGDANNYFPAKLDQKIEFPDNLSGLYWQIEAKGKEGNSDYSPWIDGLTAISYSYWK